MMATYSNRPLLLDNILFEYLFANNVHEETFDDIKLKRLSTILSNIPYNTLKQAYDSYQKKHQHDKCEVKNIQQQKEKSQQQQQLLLDRQRQEQSFQSSQLFPLQQVPSTSNKYKKQANSELYVATDTNSNMIVIHVCDEAKQLKKDFQCPRDLLIREMKYFSNSMNLNTSNSMGSQSALIKRNLEDMDISVHCDINIFEWLMRYVKRNVQKSDDDTSEQQQQQQQQEQEPKLEITNCVSILISSDFLVMNELVDRCLLFMVENITQVLQIPCNLNTINDHLIAKIGAFIKLQQLDEIPDKKEKFKTKLYMKKIEFYFDCDKYRRQFEYHENDDENAHIEYDEDDTMSLFRCKICGRILTQKQSKYIKCQLGLLDKHGNYNYFHVSDEKFDINMFLIDLKEKLKSWQHVFWFLWALMKCARCQTCKEWFRFVDLSRCMINGHAECPVHRAGVKKSIALTLKPLSGANEPPVEIKTQSCLCQFKDHSLDLTSFAYYYTFYPLKQPQATHFNQYLLDFLYKHKEVICFGNGIVQPNKSMSFCSFVEQQYQQLPASQDPSVQPLVNNCFLDSITGQHISFFSKSYLSLLSLTNSQQQLEASPHLSLSMDITEYLKSVIMLDPLNAFNSHKALSFLKIDTKKKWDQSRAPRWNQDNQREDDTRRFREIGSYLFKLRTLVDQNIAALTQKLNANKISTLNVATREPSGGFYARIENDWKVRQVTCAPTYFSQPSNNSNNQIFNSNQYQTAMSGNSGFSKQQQMQQQQQQQQLTNKPRQSSIAPLNKF